MDREEKGLDRFGRGDFRDIAEIIGTDNAVKVSDAFGGCTITIPKLGRTRREARDKAIREAYDGGASVRHLARQYGLTTRRVYDILGAKP